MRGKTTRTMHTKEDLKKHKKGKEYIANRLAEQESMSKYTMIDINDVPESLNERGIKKWNDLIPLLHELPIAELDRDLVASFCEVHQDRIGYRLGENDMTYNQYLSLVKETRMLANQLGMTMSSRLELTTADEDTEEDEITKLLKGF